ncbi:MAG: SDR family oxidoreductase, partial [Phycisphaeraceae bacterium]|nr:SDR family oxidoreductase [Phycisphaeraceae bacterium]
ADQLAAVASSCREAATFVCDVRDPEQVSALVAFAVERFGQLDVMVNNAGLAVYGPVLDSTPADVDAMLDTNVKGVIYGSQAALRVMKDRQSGLIVNVSSIAGKLHLPNEAVYNASKWAVNGFTGTLRLEANRFGVKVTCACPGGIDTPFWDGMARTPFPADKIVPERDFMSPDEVAESIVQVAETSDRYVVPEIVMLPMIR